MYDVALEQATRANRLGAGVLTHLGTDPFALATIHRAENTDSVERLTTIVDALRIVARKMKVAWPVHPRTRAALEKSGLWEHANAGLHLMDPQGYLDMVRLERSAAVVVTDSGGVQREAYFHGVPCITIRDETEWTELISLRWNRLAPPTDPEVVAFSILSAIGSKGVSACPYGDGNAARS
jgi:UDP-GlcNAc3NAcA epimerase